MSSEKRLPVTVDIGGTKTVVAVHRDGTADALDRFPTPDDPRDAVRAIVASVERAGLRDAAGAVGIGAPGPLDSRSGRMLAPPNLPGWKDFPLAEMITDALGIPVRLENDANLGALGEAVHGSGRGLGSMFYLTISTGIGSGLVIGGRIHGGLAGLAGEAWAMRPGLFRGRTDGPTVMDLASGPGLVRRARERMRAGRETILDAGALDAPALVAAATDGDGLALDVLEEGRDAAAGLLAAVIQTIAPEAVVLGGGLCTDPAWYVDPIRDRIRSWVDIPGLRDTPVYRARLWDNAVLYGAASLVEDFCRT